MTQCSNLYTSVDTPATEIAYDTTISKMEVWIRGEATPIFGKTSARLHRREVRDAIPHREGTQDVLSEMTLQQKSTAGGEISFNFAPKVCMYFTLVSPIKTSQKAWAKCIQRIAVGTSYATRAQPWLLK